MPPHERKIADMLATLRGHWRRLQVSWFATTALLAALFWLLSLVILDNFLVLSSRTFIIAWAVLLLAVATWVGVLIFRVTLQPPSNGRLALLFESRTPRQRNRLINAVEFLTLPDYRRDPLALVAVAENAAALDAAAARRAVSFAPLRRALFVFFVLGLLTAGYGLLRPHWIANAFERLTNPFAPAAHLAATTPIVTPGDAEIIEGDPLQIDVTLELASEATPPTRVYLDYRFTGEDWRTSALARLDDTHFTHGFDFVRADFDYRVRAGRSTSPTYRVRVQPRPHVDHLRMTVAQPAYAGGNTRELPPNVGDVTAAVDSRLTLAIRATQPLKRAAVKLTDGRDLPMVVDRAEPQNATVTFPLTSSAGYTIHLTSFAGLDNLRPPRFQLIATPDEAPIVAVTRPGRDLILPTNATIDLTIEAQDDRALANLALQTRAGGGAWTDQQTWAVDDGRTYTVHTSLTLASLHPQPGDTILYRAAATDRRTPEAQIGYSRTWSITLVEPEDDAALLAAQARRLLEALRRILDLQRENRTAVDYDRPVPPISQRQLTIRTLTADAAADYSQSLRPRPHIVAELTSLVDGPLRTATTQLADYDGPYERRAQRKPDLLATMDEIIARLAALIGELEDALADADRAQAALADLDPQEREQALADIRELLTRLRDFIPEQDQVIADTSELARRGEDFTPAELETLERLRGTEDKWAEIFTASVQDITKLTEQGFADATIANDYKEMIEQIEAASLNLTPDLIELAVPREQSGRELAEALVEEMEMWLPSNPDNIKWVMEEPLDFPDIPMVELPDQLWDLVGDLIEDQDELNDAAEDVTSAWADSLAEGAGWEVAGGPISNFSAVGKTGNQLPDDNELSGRSGDGRSGRSQGQLVENIAKGLPGRDTPTRVTNDPYEEGVVKELQQLATSGATGGGKARGAGQEGLQGERPPPLMTDLQFMQDWQKRIRQEAERIAGQLKMVEIRLPDLQRAIELMRAAEQAAAEGRYQDMFAHQQMVMQHLRMSGELAARQVALEIDRAYQLPPDQRRKILDAFDEPIPEEYRTAVERYFLQLSESR